MRITNDFVFFLSPPFSQWAKTKFVDGIIEFVTAEQYMMYHKALFFNDNDIAEEIMKTNDPREQKSLGRKVKNFDVNQWASVARDIVYDGNMLKFEQNTDYAKALNDTGFRIIVEAASYDEVWGIKMSENDVGIETPSNWKGKNWLGQVLMRVRHDIRYPESKIGSFRKWPDSPLSFV